MLYVGKNPIHKLYKFIIGSLLYYINIIIATNDKFISNSNIKYDYK